MAGDFFDEADFFEAGEDSIRLSEGDGELFFGVARGDGGLLEEAVKKWECAGHVAEGFGDLLAGAFAEGDDFPGSSDGISNGE